MKIVYSVKSLQIKNKQQKNPNLILTITITPDKVNCYRNKTTLVPRFTCQGVKSKFLLQMIKMQHLP